jgi:ectoine hydroxylase-related dioxygenase (phytanoyl-CoA dioxygenase family)
MSVLPGSHLGLPLEHEDTYHEDNMLTRGQSIKEIDESCAVSMPLKAGEMSIHNYCLAHGSGPNLSDDRRIGVSMHFMPPQTKQVVASWDCAAVVRGEDRRQLRAGADPDAGFRPVAVAFHARGRRRCAMCACGGRENLQRL